MYTARYGGRVLCADDAELDSTDAVLLTDIVSRLVSTVFELLVPLFIEVCPAAD